VRTLNLNIADTKFFKDRICNLKSQVNPAELRISKPNRITGKGFDENNNPFYYIPNYFKEAIFIGTKPEAQHAVEVFQNFLIKERIS
jgi:hypothetical protein